MAIAAEATKPWNLVSPMDVQRKWAYRQLLFWAMLEIRLYCPLHGKFNADPVVWRTWYERGRIAGAIADWFHNLADYSSQDFEGFNEERFWQEHAHFCDSYPDGPFSAYRVRFDQYLGNGADSSQPDTVARLRPAK